MSILNTFVSNSTISSATMNATLADIGSEITNSLPRDGQAAMTAAFKAYAGTLAAPGIAFGVDTSTGIRRSAGGTMRHVSAGVDIMEVSATGVTMVAGTITDANAVVVVGMPTGVILPYGSTTAPTGWVRTNAKTIGNASSAATERANADTENLFTFLWNNYSNSVCAVSSGRGVSAAADYAANKTIALPDLRGRGLFGLDDMGNTAAARLGTIISSSTTNGASGGTETHTLTSTEMPVHTHTGNTNSATDSIRITANFLSTSGTAATNVITTLSGSSTNFDFNTAGHTHSFTTAATGAGGAHSNMPPAFLTTFIIKL